MSRSRYFVHGAAMSAVQRAASVAYGLVALPIGLNHFGLAGFGVWLTLQSVAGYLASGAVGMPLAVLGAISRNPSPEDRAAILRHALRVIGTAGVAVAVGLFAVLGAWDGAIEAIGTDELPPAVVRGTAWVLLVGTALLLPLTAFPSALGGQGRIVAQQAYETLKIVARLAALIWVVLAGGSLVMLAVGTVVADLAVGLIAGAHLLMGRDGIRLSHARGAPPERLLRSGMRFMGLQLEMAVIQNTDNIVTNAVVGASSVAVLAAPQRAFRVASAVISGAISAPGWPALGASFAAQDWRRIDELHARQVRAAVVLGAASWIVGQVALPPLIRLWLGEAFPVDHSTILWLGAYVFVLAYVGQQGVLLNAMDRTSGQLKVLGVEAAVNLGVSIFLARRFGIAGVAAGSVIGAALVSAGGLTLAVRKETGARVRTGGRLFLTTASYTGLACIAIAVASSMGQSLAAAGIMLIALALVARHHGRFVWGLLRAASEPWRGR